MQTMVKSLIIISGTGFIPDKDAPMAAPIMACSEIGVARTRSSPCLVDRPTVALVTPPAGSAISSPNRKTSGSFSSARSRASVTA